MLRLTLLLSLAIGRLSGAEMPVVHMADLPALIRPADGTDEVTIYRITGSDQHVAHPWQGDWQIDASAGLRVGPRRFKRLNSILTNEKSEGRKKNKDT